MANRTKTISGECDSGRRLTFHELQAPERLLDAQPESLTAG